MADRMKAVQCGECGCDTVRLQANESSNGAGFTRLEATCTRCGETTIIRLTQRMDFWPKSDAQSGRLTTGGDNG